MGVDAVATVLSLEPARPMNTGQNTSMNMGAAARMKRYRQRQRNGVQVVRIEVDQHSVESLLMTRRLKREDIGNSAAIAAAIEALMKTV